MRKQRITYFTSGLLIQLAIFTLIGYWLATVSATQVDEAIIRFESRLPSFLQDTTVIMIIVAGFTAISMMCYAAARKYSLSRSFRNLALGLILLNAIVLLWILLSLM